MEAMKKDEKISTPLEFLPITVEVSITRGTSRIRNAVLVDEVVEGRLDSLDKLAHVVAESIDKLEDWAFDRIILATKADKVMREEILGMLDE